MTPQERLDYLLESVLIRTENPITVAEIVEAVGIDAGRLVVGTLQAASQQDPILAASFTALSTVGMLLSSDDRQQLIDDLAGAGNWPDEVRDEVKALGAFWQPRWVGEGYETKPTLDTVTDEIAEEVEKVHRQNAKIAGVRFGEQFQQGQDAGAVMAAIWEEITDGD